jgi:hypothetical protein
LVSENIPHSQASKNGFRFSAPKAVSAVSQAFSNNVEQQTEKKLTLINDSHSQQK